MRLFKKRANTLVNSFVKYFDECGEYRYTSIIKTNKRVNFLEQYYNFFYFENLETLSGSQGKVC